jgi:catechol 2,3-dioxygenase-like lactoylglutathione lyase family enzyme
MYSRINITSMYVLDQDQALEFYVGKLGLEVAEDQDLGFMRWLTIRVPGDPSRQILLERPGPPALDEATAAQARELVAKGATAGALFLATDDVHAVWATLKDRGVELTEEPVQQPYGTDFGLRDPFGNAIRIGQLTDG